LLKSFSRKLKINPRKNPKNKKIGILIDLTSNIVVSEFKRGIKNINKNSPILGLKAVIRKIKSIKRFKEKKNAELSWTFILQYRKKII